MADMDPQIKALAAIKREITKIVGKGETLDDKMMIIEFGERQLATLKINLAEPSGKKA